MNRDGDPAGNRAAAAGSAVFFLVAPASMGVLLPALITGGWNSAEDVPLVASLGGLLVGAAGLGCVAACFIRFVSEGRGTPAPVAPTEFLVVGGLYRRVRNPMYVGVIAMIAGQAIALGSMALAIYALVFFAVTASFVRFYEEPALTRQFGESYERYRNAVPGWIPRRRPWDGPG